MASFNKVMLMGNLTRDPEVRYTPKGTAVTDLGIAVNRKFRVEDEMREEVTFVDITFWGRKAEVIAQYMKKGGGIFIEGRLQMDSWDDRTTGKKRYQLKVIGETFEFVGSSGGGGGSGSGSSGGGSYNSGGGYGGNEGASQSAQDGGGGESRGASLSEAPQSFPPDLDDDSDQIPF
ncbi:MAG: single-stranded DNA-binding protein [Verrucomicrobiae bacterium]|nr:single-stranded DNA-binding protein [Verrucomicrobiae bacterium]